MGDYASKGLASGVGIPALAIEESERIALATIRIYQKIAMLQKKKKFILSINV